MEEGYRILIVDDLSGIHQDFKKILLPESNPVEEGLEKLNAELFGKVKETNLLPKFTLDDAFQGEEAIKLVKTSVEEGKPYAVAFVDVVMPPGIDGIETIFCMWSIDPNIQVVICTAYSVYTWEEIIRRLGDNDQLQIVKKPFDKIEISSLAYTLSKRWDLSRRIRKELSKIEAMVSSSELASKVNVEETLVKLSEAIGNLKDLNKHLISPAIRTGLNTG